jgi:2-polyprenyl-3-methyl-5-hydroxy-6-metoxy-1,4-benzoquinol methylase
MGTRVQDERGFNQVFSAVGSSPFRAERRHQWFISQAKQKRAKRILEIGCGTGEAAASVACGTGAEVVGVDISGAFIEQARTLHKASNLRFEKINLFSGDQTNFGSFDFVFGNGILHHLVNELERVLTILRSMTNGGGGMSFIEPNFMNPYCAFIFGTKIGRKYALLEPDEMAFRAAELRKIIASAGWSNVQLQTRDFLLPGLPVRLIKPILVIEPALEATFLTRWLAQSHFVNAEAH